MRVASAVLVGVAFGGLTLGMVGRNTDRVVRDDGGRAVAGGLAGAAIGGLVGLGAARGRVGPSRLGALAYGAVGCVLGPGYDDYQGVTGAMLAAVGATLGAFGTRYLVAFPAAILGAILAVRLLPGSEAWPSSGLVALTGFVVVGWAGLLGGARLEGPGESHA